MNSPQKSGAHEPTVKTLRERLVEATLQLLRDEVPTDLTVRRIATAAGTTTMAVYTCFGGRDGLLDAVYADGFEQLRARMAPAAAVADPVQSILALLEAYRTFALANPGLYGLLFERTLPGFDPSPDVRSTALDTTFGLLATQAERVLNTTEQTDATRKLAYTLWALTHGLVSLELSHASRSPLAHPALGDSDAQDVLNAALRATLTGWSETTPQLTDRAPDTRNRPG